ncbi:MAG: hypothetical protein INR65_20705 [Gluconacetobacter diazotrophicus]|nr:hypothetical protein [Gluconacetobacter diazotrophicus]
MTPSRGFFGPQARSAAVFGSYASRACSVASVEGLRFLATLEMAQSTLRRLGRPSGRRV